MSNLAISRVSVVNQLIQSRGVIKEPKHKPDQNNLKLMLYREEMQSNQVSVVIDKPGNNDLDTDVEKRLFSQLLNGIFKEVQELYNYSVEHPLEALMFVGLFNIMFVNGQNNTNTTPETTKGENLNKGSSTKDEIVWWVEVLGGTLGGLSVIIGCLYCIYKHINKTKKENNSPPSSVSHQDVSLESLKSSKSTSPDTELTPPRDKTTTINIGNQTNITGNQTNITYTGSVVINNHHDNSVKSINQTIMPKTNMEQLKDIMDPEYLVTPKDYKYLYNIRLNNVMEPPNKLIEFLNSKSKHGKFQNKDDHFVWFEPKGVSMKDFREIIIPQQTRNGNLFDERYDFNHNYKKEDFYTEKTKYGTWNAMLIIPVPKAINMTFEDQKKFLTYPEIPPSARSLYIAHILYFDKSGGNRLLSNVVNGCCVRTSTFNHNNSVVNILHNESLGMEIRACDPYSKSNSFGIGCKQTFS